ncbi:MAG: HAMP domain-containing histidine kinase [Candidatus Dormibacteraeota bacterium]|nr:HAMP domain-containing histidine kinase [Candidatus Dormibacteraeota bacterium]
MTLHRAPGADQSSASDPQALAMVSLVCGRIAHDLNNLLAAVEGYAEFIAEGVADRPLVLADIAEVRTAAKQGAGFARRLRQVGQLGDAVPEVVDLSRVVREAEEQVRLLCGARARAVFELAADLPAARADPGQLQLVLLSLVENAVEAVTDGTEIKVSTLVEGHDVALRVSDQGRGMSADARAHLFEPFFTTKPRAMGTGLGMFIVEAVVRAAGGRVAVVSTEGAGTTVTLHLPATA